MYAPVSPDETTLGTYTISLVYTADDYTDLTYTLDVTELTILAACEVDNSIVLTDGDDFLDTSYYVRSGVELSVTLPTVSDVTTGCGDYTTTMTIYLDGVEVDPLDYLFIFWNTNQNKVTFNMPYSSDVSTYAEYAGSTFLIEFTYELADYPSVYTT